MHLHYAARTDVGLVRERQEDAWFADGRLFAVADGMGGHQGGDVASRLVTEALAELDLPERISADKGADLLIGAFATAHARINDHARARRMEGHQGYYAGTTAVAALLVDAPEPDAAPLWLIANIGDSRAYALSEIGLMQATVDHSRVQELYDAGAIERDEMERHPERNVVTRALGGTDLPEPDCFLLMMADARRLLLCTDGVSGLLDDQDLADIVAGVADLDEAADRLIGGALAAGGHDNATAILIEASEQA